MTIKTESYDQLLLFTAHEIIHVVYEIIENKIFLMK